MHDRRPGPINHLGLVGRSYPQVFNALTQPLSLEARKVYLFALLRPHPTIPGFYVDHEGWLVRWPEYGLQSNYGWEIDHIVRKADGGSDEIWNLRARHWWPNRSAGSTPTNALPPMFR